MGAEVVGCQRDRSSQVGAADVTDEQGVPGEESGVVWGVLVEIEGKNRDGLDGVAGGFEDLQAQSRKVERIAVLHRHEGILRMCARAEMDGRAATVAQFQMAGDEVSVEVGEKDMSDLKAKILGVGQVLLDIALGVDHVAGTTRPIPAAIVR